MAGLQGDAKPPKTKSRHGFIDIFLAHRAFHHHRWLAGLRFDGERACTNGRAWYAGCSGSRIGTRLASRACGQCTHTHNRRAFKHPGGCCVQRVGGRTSHRRAHGHTHSTWRDVIRCVSACGDHRGDQS